MRIAFDLDDTLFKTKENFPTEKHWINFVFRERLRYGAIDLLKVIQSKQHDIWIYTTSLRNEYYLRLYFLMLGINLGGVINYTKHVKTMKLFQNKSLSVSKYPPAFQIDLLIDDLEGVKIEGKRYGFSVYHLTSEDKQWVENILELIETAK